MAERKTWEAEDRSRRNTHFKGMATVIHFPLQASCPSFPSSHIPLNCDSANGSKHWFGQRPHDLIIPHMPPLWTLNRRPNFQPMSLLRIIYSQATTMDNNHFYCYNFIIYFLFLCNWNLKHTSFYHLYKFQCSTLKRAKPERYSFSSFFCGAGQADTAYYKTTQKIWSLNHSFKYSFPKLMIVDWTAVPDLKYYKIKFIILSSLLFFKINL
jgi:hypothetical protein